MSPGVMKKIIILFFLVSIVIFQGCVHADKNCKANHKKAKKNNIGWKY
jgi:hypothetical protein